MSDDLVNIEVDGRPLRARRGQMLIQATDGSGIYVPRFCYHEKLSIAANCRMCLVEVEKAPKPLPACATPVAEGMKVFTRSPKAIAAQKATMEFLLINHPLDCPVCDQGGECELQDLALGFGSAGSRFDEGKRAVADQSIGPLISTDMTRCIHCTRCVRFTSEIAGIQELGAMGRGENMRISTWIECSVDHELSGNVIDLCPVGALNSQPFRNRARSWEMTERALVSPHDPVGTNMNGHVLRGRLMRIVPRPNEAVNETWIADRDRYSYEGVYAPDRLLMPMLKSEGQWREIGWEAALAAAAEGLQAAARTGAGPLGFLGSPGATTEELWLLGRIARGLGSGNIDTRLRQLDFRDQDQDPAWPGLGIELAEVDRLDALLLIGCRPREEAPIFAHRVRKAVLAGARVSLIDTRPQELHFPVLRQLVVPAAAMLGELAALLQAAAAQSGRPLPATVAPLAATASPTDAHRAVVAALLDGTRRAIVLGGLAQRHTRYADLRVAAAALAVLTGATLGYLADGGNAAGAALAGALPHREPGGRPAQQAGLDTGGMLGARLGACVLFGGVEPDADFGARDATAALASCPFVIAMTPFASESLRKAAQLLLPIGTFAETSGTYVNCEGRWQEFAGCARPVGEARPGWKVLRVLGNLLGLPDFDFATPEELRAALRQAVGHPVRGEFAGTRVIDGDAGGSTTGLPIYRGDAILRRATALQATRAGQAAAAD